MNERRQVGQVILPAVRLAGPSAEIRRVRKDVDALPLEQETRPAHVESRGDENRLPERTAFHQLPGECRILPRVAALVLDEDTGGRDAQVDEEAADDGRLGRYVLEGLSPETTRGRPVRLWRRAAATSRTIMSPVGTPVPPASGAPPATPQQQPQPSGGLPAGQVLPTAEIPAEVLEDVRKAIEGGDVKGLMKLLQQEHSKRTPGSDPGTPEESIAAPPPDQPAIDKDQVDALMQIAKDNSVSVDWLILRAIKVYVQEYQKTGKL